ncbi:DNA-packaging protein [Salmonella enterica subsp. salamae]|nr:DNA-packaging protein [Salmonella enterica subsp. salamae]SQH40203.1 Uncharacterised protein [Salmonella enterica]
MASKTDLLARLDQLSEQLGRELPRTGTIGELEIVIASAEAELEMLDEEVGEEVGEPENTPPAETAAASEREKSAIRPVKLRTTLDIFHYVGGARIREIVVSGREINVDNAEASELINAGRACAL